MLINGVMPEIEGLVNGEIYNSDGVQVRVHIVPRLDSCSSLTGLIRGVRWMRGNEAREADSWFIAALVKVGPFYSTMNSNSRDMAGTTR
jgi:hypothetical protein